MSVTASSRFGVASAPEGLALVQELLNTLAVHDAPDLLAGSETAQPWIEAALAQWAERTGQAAPAVALTARDLPRLRSLRARVRSSADPGRATVSRSVTSTITLSLADEVGAVPRGVRSAWLTSAVLLECFLAQRDNTWLRLKTCRNEDCRVAFFDRTKGNNAVWHDFRHCGNAINLRASRARRKAASAT